MVDAPEGRRLIEELRVGDQVWCFDPEDGSRECGTLRAIRGARRECVMLSVHGEEALFLTRDHPVYSPKYGSYGDASHWVSGEVEDLVQISGDLIDVVPVRMTRPDGGVREVFDITLDHQLHNFAANGILVHNRS